MRFILPVLCCILCSCTDQKPVNVEKTKADPLVANATPRENVVSEFQSIIDSAKVNGAILIYDLEADTYFSNDFERVEKGNLPASTFKIPNSIIALETGVMASDSTLIKWDGQPKRMKRWEQDLVFRDAFHFSCVPCYQDIARAVGVERMKESLAALGYGGMEVDSTNLDLFWLEGSSTINQFQQIDFLRRFYQSELPITQRIESIMKRMLVVAETERYTLSGKTGWSVQNGQDNGWFVGYVETIANTYFFATNVEPSVECEMNQFFKIRTQITEEALRVIGVIE